MKEKRVFESGLCVLAHSGTNEVYRATQEESEHKIKELKAARDLLKQS